MNARRNNFKSGLSGLYLPYYLSLCELLPDHWQPISGYRNFQLQAKLYAMGRTAPGRIVTKAKPGYSLHNYGYASDWAYFEGTAYIDLPFEDSRWNEYRSACDKVGIVTLDWERPHNQIATSVKIDEMLMAYESGGQEAVDKLVREKL